MPKIKTRKSTAKRFRLTASGESATQQVDEGTSPDRQEPQAEAEASQERTLTSGDKKRILRQSGERG